MERMRTNIDERTDRLVRRWWGYADRSTMLWAFTRLHVALRDVERDLFQPFGVHKPDWDRALRPFVWAGLGYGAIIILGFVITTLLH